MDAKLGELEKEILLREAAGQNSNAAFSTLNTSKGAGSIDISKMSSRDNSRKEDQVTIDDLGD